MSRDTQFTGFARALLKELDEAIGGEANRVTRGETPLTREAFAQMLGDILAGRAYDLAVHVTSHMEQQTLLRMWVGMLSPRQVVEIIPIPDMEELM